MDSQQEGEQKYFIVRYNSIKKNVISAVHLYTPHSLIIHTCDNPVHRSAGQIRDKFPEYLALRRVFCILPP